MERDGCVVTEGMWLIEGVWLTEGMWINEGVFFFYNFFFGYATNKASVFISYVKEDVTRVDLARNT